MMNTVKKMITKQTLGSLNEEDEDIEDKGNAEDRKLDERIRKEEARMRMAYDKTTKGLDLGNLRASDYKFNKFIHLPLAIKMCIKRIFERG